MTKRPYDDLETDYLEEENESGFLSLVSVVIAFIAVAVFIALAWYAYQSSTKSDSQEEIQVVYPEEGAVREAPEETGGWQFPHQDKSVYNIVSGDEKPEEAKVEQILPAPEQPVKRPDAETKTWMNDKLKQDAIAKTDAERQKEAKAKAQAEAEEAVTEETAETPAEDAAVEAEKKARAEAAAAAIAAEKEAQAKAAAEAERVAKEAVKVAGVPAKESVTVKEEPVATEAKPAAETQTQPVKAPVKVETKAVPKPVVAAPVASGGSARLQLGAVKSDADARAQWQKMQAKYPALAGKSLNVEAVTIPGKGTLYRIQAVGFASKTEATAACGKISAAGQACFAIGK